MHSLVRLAASAALCLSALTAHAASVEFEMRTADTLPAGPLYGTLTLTQTGDTIQFDARPGPYWSAIPGTTGIAALWFDFTDTPVLSPSEVRPPNFIYTGLVDRTGFGAFTYEYAATSPAVPSLSFTITRPGLRLEDFLIANDRGWGAAMQIVQDPATTHPPTWGADSSRYFVAARVPVPEPSAAALLLAGLALLAGIVEAARMRKR